MASPTVSKPESGGAQPAATSQTQPNATKPATQVPVTPPRKLTYVFHATSSSNLQIPYAVSVDGKCLDAFAAKPKRVSGAKGKVEVFVKEGSKVALYLNSDAHPSYRKQAVYAVTMGVNDIKVMIEEEAGKISKTDALVAVPAKAATGGAAAPVPMVPAPAAAVVDEYTAALTGDLWMKVSHKYSAAEAESLLPAGTSEAVKAAVKSIYTGLAVAELIIHEPASGTLLARTLSVSFADSDNPKHNINSYSLLTDGLPRVHPAGYAALFTAALDNSIASVSLSSCWRPMLGSIAHRAGLGLDVSILGGTKMNRQELRNAFLGKKPSKSGNSNDDDNVTDAEVTAFGEYEDAIIAAKEAGKANAAAMAALKNAKAAKDEAAKVAAEKDLAEKQDALRVTAKSRDQKEGIWNKERDAGEPKPVAAFRVSLLKCRCVRQLFDPWFVNPDTHSGQASEPNMQRGAATDNERLHAHHLHITVDEPKIL